jgi:hypothetical protein
MSEKQSTLSRREQQAQGAINFYKESIKTGDMSVSEAVETVSSMSLASLPEEVKSITLSGGITYGEALSIVKSMENAPKSESDEDYDSSTMTEMKASQYSNNDAMRELDDSFDQADMQEANQVELESEMQTALENFFSSKTQIVARVKAARTEF